MYDTDAKESKKVERRRIFVTEFVAIEKNVECSKDAVLESLAIPRPFWNPKPDPMEKLRVGTAATTDFDAKQAKVGRLVICIRCNVKKKVI